MDFLTRKLAGYVLTVLWASALAATGHYAPLSHVFADTNVLTTAVTSTSPSSTLVDRVGVLNNGEHSESLTGHVNSIPENNQWGLNSLSERPAKVIHPTAHALYVEHEVVAPFGNGESFALVSDSPIRACVVRLPLAGGPPAIVWFVVAVDVNAIQGISVRPRTHIRKKCIERCAPPFADSNPTSSVFGEPDVLGIAAPALHRVPRAILSASTTCDVSVFPLGNSSCAPAIRTCSSSETLGGNFTLCAAFTAAQPIFLSSVPRRCFGDHSPF